MDHDDAGLTLLIYNLWYAYIYKGHHKAKRAGCIDKIKTLLTYLLTYYSRRPKGQQVARKGQQGVAPCYLHLAGAL